MTTPIRPDLSSLADRWPSALVARSEVGRFTGGIINARYIANLDSRGEGPPGRIRTGRKISYPVGDLIAWLEARSVLVE